MAPGRRPNPYVNYAASWGGAGTANYNALNVSLVKRATHGLAFKANYSYSKVLDLNSAILAVSGENEPASLFSPYNRFLNRGVAAYSLAHQFNANFSYQLPFGNAGRSELRGPGLVDIDTSLFKKIKISERWNLQLRAEVFNVLNHSNFSLANPIVFDGNPANSTYSSSAGQIYQSSTSARQLQ